MSYTDKFGAETRSLRLRIPKALTNANPLIFYVHGAQGTITECEAHGWHTKAENVGAVLACPLGLPQSTGHTTWNNYFNQATYTEGHAPDDVSFFRTMIGLIQTNLKTDPNAVFVTGLSAGAGMAHRLGNELGDKIAAIAPMAQTARTYNAGTVPIPVAPLAVAPVSVLILQGDKDGGFPYCGKFSQSPTQAVVESVDFDFTFWSSRDKCAKIDQLQSLCTADYTGTPRAMVSKHGSSCSAGTDVQFYRLAGGIHKYYGAGTLLTSPPGDASHPFNPAFGATVGTDGVDIIWNYFAAHKKSQAIPPPPPPPPPPAPGKLLTVVSDASDVDITKTYFVGGVKEVPGDVVKAFYEQCGGAQTMNACSKWYQVSWWCDPTLICKGKNFWSKKKGYLWGYTPPK